MLIRGHFSVDSWKTDSAIDSLTNYCNLNNATFKVESISESRVIDDSKVVIFEYSYKDLLCQGLNIDEFLSSWTDFVNYSLSSLDVKLGFDFLTHFV